MDRDNPFGSSYIREGASRVQKPRLTYRQTDPTMPVSNNTAGVGHISHPVGPVATKRPSPHLRLQRRLSVTSDTSAKPAVADDNDSDVGFIPPVQNRNYGRRNSASMSVRSNASTATRRNSNRGRVVRPADHSRPTVHFSSGRSEVLLTLPAPALAPAPASSSQTYTNMSGCVPELPVAPTSTALSRRPSNRRSTPVFGTNEQYPRQPIYDSVYGSTAGSISTNHNQHGTGNSYKKTVTFDSSETEDSISCLSNSTQATSVDEHDSYGYYDYIPEEKAKNAPVKTTTITVDYSHSQQTPPSPSNMSSSTATMSPPTRPQTTRRRSQSFSGIVDHEMSRTESGLVHLPARRSLRDSYAHIPAGAIEDTPTPASISSSTSDSDRNIQAQFEAHKVALEAQFEQRQQALEAERKKLAVELNEAVAALGEAQAERNDLRREAAEHRQRAKSLSEEIDDLHESMDKSLQLKDSESLEMKELRADLESNKTALGETQAALAVANQALADANVLLVQVRDSLRDEEATSALFREGKAAFEERCGDLEAKCEGLEGQVVAARDANKELHLLMAGQIEDLIATKDALQVRIGVLEEEEATRVAATAISVAAAASAEEKATIDAKTFAEEKASLEEKLAAAEAKCTTLEGDKEALDAEVKDLKSQIETLTADVASKTTEIESLNAELAKAKEENATQQDTITGHEAIVDKARQEAEEAATAAATEAADGLKETIAKLEEAQAALAAECEALKANGVKTAEGEGGSSETASVPDAELQEKHSKLEAAHNELQEKLTALESTLATEKEAASAALATAQAAQTEAATALAAAQESATAAKEEAATRAAQVPELTQQNVNLATELAAHNDRVQELRAAYATSEAEGMALRDQLAKMRAKLAGVAGSVTSTGSNSSKKGSKKNNKDELVIVRTPGDRGRFQVMRKSDLHRSPSRSSRKADYDST